MDQITICNVKNHLTEFSSCLLNIISSFYSFKILTALLSITVKYMRQLFSGQIFSETHCTPPAQHYPPAHRDTGN